jgi:hypothetical protein
MDGMAGCLHWAVGAFIWLTGGLENTAGYCAVRDYEVRVPYKAGGLGLPYSLEDHSDRFCVE